MKNFFKPKSVVVIGVSRDPHKIGYTIFDNLTSSYKGKVFGVNPNATEILGHKLYKSVLDIKDQIDLAIVSVPQQLAPQVVEACGKKKIPYAIVITSGFSEAGAAGKEREQALRAAAKKFGVRILGPNCLGLINNFESLNASFACSKLPGLFRVGMFSQSGAMGAALLDYANGNNFGFSYFVSLGNKIDISEVDLIKAWEDDDNVKVAIGYLEDIKDGEAFLEAARKFTAKKPLILLKGGMTKKGEKAAGLHTAAMAQDETVFKAAMREAGVILAENLNDLFEFGVAFAVNGMPKSRRLVIISNAGGPSVLAADAAEKEGVELPSLSGYTTHTLLSKTEAASVANPLDLRGDAKREDFRLALSLCEKDPNVDGILLIVTPQSMTEVEAIAWEAVTARREGKKPIFVNFIGGELIERAVEVCNENNIPVFSYPERAVRAFASQADFATQKRIAGRELKRHEKHHVAKSVIHFASGKMTPDRLSSLLEMYGVPMAKTILAKTPREAGEALEKIKPPVVMKISSPQILHKTDVGGVIFGVQTAEEANLAYKKILGNVKANNPAAHIDGVIVMEMAKEGLELIVGAKRDAVFGPSIMFGFGGIFVELINDFSVAIGPFTREKIERMIDETVVSKIIKGYRVKKKYDREELVTAILGVAKLITEHKEIESLEINPLILEDGRGALGLDAKIKLNEKF